MSSPNAPDVADASRVPPRRRRIPLALKVLYTLFVAVLAPCYWYRYGPANFLYFCDLALLLTCLALWIESRLIVSMQAITILLPQLLWMVDFTSMGLLGKSPFQMTGYMFSADIPLFIRGLSTFHFWLPILLLGLVWRLGYDRRALLPVVLFGWAILAFCYFILPALSASPGHPGPPRNINYVFGLDESSPQKWMDGRLWFALLMTLFPLAVCLPTHLALRKLFPPRAGSRRP